MNNPLRGKKGKPSISSELHFFSSSGRFFKGSKPKKKKKSIWKEIL
jgi:hypothetical protein